MTVITMRSRLTERDIHALVRGADEEERADAAYKIARAIDSDALTADERVHAREVLVIIARDAADRVRRALAVALRQSPHLPADIARKLASDIEDVALPILEHSPVLTDGDLVEMVRAGSAVKQTAIAGRSTLSEAVTEIIAEHGAPEAVARALANEGASFSEDSLHKVLERLHENESVVNRMVRRRILPVTVVEKLVSIAVGSAFDHLVNHHALPPQLAIDIAANARERASLDLIVQAGLQNDLRRFAQQLHLHGRLTPSFLMRAICLGHMEFVEYAFAELAGLSRQRAWRLLHDEGNLGLKTLFERSGMPGRLFPVFQAAIQLYHELERDGNGVDGQLLRARMIERALTLFGGLPRDDLDYLLERLDAREAAA